ncbi:hypothetical protein HYH03_014748 [Edaphochlamys debaryana]|uniref:Protein kinase domain-containing protein n=1 Tax=Edaphochlamys debaryana TaxID=47281 RepID=A0A835XPH7_9CHLO|nr:hypothetical protein HYH03_014748 [Edaphochlamys debaryana]|eukprot:KAG2486578.1 hypothetical protein HYH03_014748 [Edaphochlamys debaryana]
MATAAPTLGPHVPPGRTRGPAIPEAPEPWRGQAPHRTDDYEPLRQEPLAEGTYAVVYACRHVASGRHVAVKAFKQEHLNHQVRRLALRELRVLRLLPPHPATVGLLDVLRDPASGRLLLVFELMGCSLEQMLDSRAAQARRGRLSPGLSPSLLRCVAWQLLGALEHCHAHGVVHRDVKPANVLVDNVAGSAAGETAAVVKLCDFGLARWLPGASPPHSGSWKHRHGGADVDPIVPHRSYGSRTSADAAMTDYVVTRWYRAPELLQRARRYGPAIDVWALGCLLAELSMGRPLFPGANAADQLGLITACLGQPPMMGAAAVGAGAAGPAAAAGGAAAVMGGVAARVAVGWGALAAPRRSRSLAQRLGSAAEPALLQLINLCLALDPAARPTATQLQQLPYFDAVRHTSYGSSSRPLVQPLELSRPVPPLLNAAGNAAMPSAQVQPCHQSHAAERHQDTGLHGIQEPVASASASASKDTGLQPGLRHTAAAARDEEAGLHGIREPVAPATFNSAVSSGGGGEARAPADSGPAGGTAGGCAGEAEAEAEGEGEGEGEGGVWSSLGLEGAGGLAWEAPAAAATSPAVSVRRLTAPLRPLASGRSKAGIHAFLDGDEQPPSPSASGPHPTSAPGQTSPPARLSDGGGSGSGGGSGRGSGGGSSGALQASGDDLLLDSCRVLSVGAFRTKDTSRLRAPGRGAMREAQASAVQRILATTATTTTTTTTATGSCVAASGDAGCPSPTRREGSFRGSGNGGTAWQCSGSTDRAGGGGGNGATRAELGGAVPWGGEGRRGRARPDPRTPPALAAWPSQVHWAGYAGPGGPALHRFDNARTSGANLVASADSSTSHTHRPSASSGASSPGHRTYNCARQISKIPTKPLASSPPLSADQARIQLAPVSLEEGVGSGVQALPTAIVQRRGLLDPMAAEGPASWAGLQTAGPVGPTEVHAGPPGPALGPQAADAAAESRRSQLLPAPPLPQPSQDETVEGRPHTVPLHGGAPPPLPTAAAAAAEGPDTHGQPPGSSAPSKGAWLWLPYFNRSSQPPGPPRDDDYPAHVGMPTAGTGAGAAGYPPSGSVQLTLGSSLGSSAAGSAAGFMTTATTATTDSRGRSSTSLHTGGSGGGRPLRRGSSSRASASLVFSTLASLSRGLRSGPSVGRDGTPYALQPPGSVTAPPRAPSEPTHVHGRHGGVHGGSQAGAVGGEAPGAVGVSLGRSTRSGGGGGERAASGSMGCFGRPARARGAGKANSSGGQESPKAEAAKAAGSGLSRLLASALGGGGRGKRGTGPDGK